MQYNNLKIIFFYFLFNFITTPVLGQINQVELGVNGLTCSQCSRSVEMQLLKIPFVRDVKMDLQHTNAIVYFKKGKRINLELLPKAVKDAGFSMRYLNIQFSPKSVNASSECFQFQGAAYYFLTPLKSNLSSIRTFQVIQKDFLPKKELAQYELIKNEKCSGKRFYFLKEMDKPEQSL